MLLTLALLAVYRIALHVPTPGSNTAELRRQFDVVADTSLEMVCLLSGGQLDVLSVYSLGLAPYNSAATIVQILTFYWPYFRRSFTEGESSRRKTRRRTRYLAIVLAV